MNASCTHLDQIRDVAADADECEDCLKTGDTWVHLRLCLECGHVGCCDNSKNRHATQHPTLQSFEPGEDWGWCYDDRIYSETLPRIQEQVAS